MMKVKCKTCGIELTNDLKHISSNAVLKEEDGEPFIDRGYYFVSDGDNYTGSEDQIIINNNDLKNSRNHDDLSRHSGCCGSDGLSGINKVCINGHEIATEKSDCWMPHSVIFDREKTVTI